jgi:hypothetical protein
MQPPGAPGGGALGTDLLARISNDMGRIPSSPQRATIFAREHPERDRERGRERGGWGEREGEGGRERGREGERANARAPECVNDSVISL